MGKGPDSSSDGLRALLGGGELAPGAESERVLRTSARVMRQIVEHSPAPVALFDREMRYIAASRRYLEDYGLGGRSLVGRSHYDVFPEIPERWKEIHRRCLAGAVERCAEDPFPRRDGRIDWVRWEVLPWFEDDGSVGGIILFSEVITSRKLGEDALRASEERFRATFEQAAVGIAHVAPDGTWLRVNQKLCDIVGYSREELATKTFQDIAHPDDLGADLELVERLLRAEIGSYELEKRYLRKSGEVVWINLTVALVRKPSGEPDYFISVIEDITRRVRATAEVERQRHLLEEAQALSHIGSVEADLVTGRVQYSAEARRIFGYRAAEPDPDIEGGMHRVHPADLEAVRERVQAAFRGEDIREVEFRVLRPDGETRWVLGRGVLRTGDEGHLHAVCSLQDVTEQRRAAEERAKLEAQLRVAQKMEAVGRLAGASPTTSTTSSPSSWAIRAWLRRGCAPRTRCARISRRSTRPASAPRPSRASCSPSAGSRCSSPASWTRIESLSISSRCCAGSWAKTSSCAWSSGRGSATCGRIGASSSRCS